MTTAPDVTARAAARFEFARAALSTPIVIAPASNDASFRSYWRVTQPSGESFVLMDAPPEREDCAPFLDVCARLAAADLTVPTPLAMDLAQGFLLLPDLGVRTLLPELRPDTVEHHYSDAMRSLLQMQRYANVAGLANYDAPRLNAEMELFPEWFLKRHLGIVPSCEEFDVIEAAMTQLRMSALAQPRTFVHRDFHSRNLMLAPDATTQSAHRRLAVIDFQDAVRGPITYDLVSLLRDCYIAWPAERLDDWVERYRLDSQRAGLHNAAHAEFRRWFDLMGLQRHLKVLGIFARLHYRDGKSGYLADLPQVLRYVLDVCAHYPEFHGFGRYLAGVTGNSA
jgi:N-acetylmuramate 1-kinase